MDKTLVALGIGILVGYFIFRGKNGSADKVIKPGSKGKDIEGMQKLFERVAGMKFETYGMYDQETLAGTRHLLKGTSALMNESGSINRMFVNDLSVLYNNSLTI
jgi:hypothetical protein